jgi:hypothetical protein
MSSNHLEEILSSASRVMLEEFKETAAIEHRGGKGSAREIILQRFLEKYTPRSVEVVSNGEVVNSSGEVSAQCDILILDGKTRPLMTEYGYHVVTAESTRGIIEVKSRLTRDELRKTFPKLLQARLMERYVPLRELSTTLPDGRRVESWPIPFVYIFAYDSISLEDVLSELAALHEGAPNLAHCIDGVWVLSQGFIKWTDLNMLDSGIGDPFPANPQIRPNFQDSSADLISVRSDESNLLLPFVADLNARLRKPEDLIGVSPYFSNGNWGEISQSAHFTFAKPARTFPVDS